ncbi:hemolysin [mine drainage metagenome]|uniref:Hemolysin n=1 Tax=mine drainage metagenome TaxID=410659 RepID=T1CSL7_9ZZZZ
MIAFAILIFLILLNGWFSLAEMAIVSARRTRLERLGRQGRHNIRRTKAALALVAEPGRFFPTIQIGITAITILVGVFGEQSLARTFASWFRTLPITASTASGLGIALLVAGITLLSILVGELIPKRLALLNPERAVLWVARPLHLLAHLVSPIASALNHLSNAALRWFTAKSGVQDPTVTTDELRALMEQGSLAGVFAPFEPALVTNVLKLDEEDLTPIMTPRVDIEALDLNAPFESCRQEIMESRYNSFPVCRDGLEHILGVLDRRDFVRRDLPLELASIPRLLRPALYLPSTASPLGLWELLEREQQHLALIVDEYGDIEGLVTRYDLLKAIVGLLPSHVARLGEVVEEGPGTWVLGGQLSLERVAELLKLPSLVPSEGRNYHTLAGFLLETFGRIPQAGDACTVEGFRFEILAMQTHRIVRVRVVRSDPPDPDDADVDLQKSGSREE